MKMSLLVRLALLLVLACATPCAAAEPRHTGPWNVAELKKPPQAEFGAKSGLVQEVYYENVPFRGKPTRVFAYYARPAEGAGPFPAMLLVHGGGGKAFREWAELWAARGYVALAMDLAGRGPDGMRLPDGGPDQDDAGKFGEFTDATVGDMWTYHAVAAVLRGHSLLAERPEVRADQIGVTGISWGGYLTCIVAGVDDRVKAAVPVYGCGFLDHNSAWVGRLSQMPPELSARWIEQFDPSKYLPGATCPMLFVNGTNDFAYPLDSYQNSYRLPKGPVTLCIRVAMPHGHPPGWAPIEIGLFVDSIFRDGKPLPTIEPIKVSGETATTSFRGRTKVTTGELHYTTDDGLWKERKWQSRPASLESTVLVGGVMFTGGTIKLDPLPKERPLTFYMTVTDERGALVSTPHETLE